MKKLFVLLLALGVAAGAFAQVTTAIAVSGSVYLYDQDGMASFAPDGSGTDMITFKATNKEATSGFSIAYNNVLETSTAAPTFNDIRDWSVWGKGKYTKSWVGKLRNGDFRVTLPIGMMHGDVYSGSTNRISGYGMLIESLPMSGLTAGAGFEIGTTAADLVDVLKKLNLGVKYSMTGLTAFALAELGLVADPQNSVFDLGASYTGMENLTANVTSRITMGATTKIEAAVGAKYVMDALTVGVEAGIDTTADAGAFAWEASARAAYAVSDVLSVQFDFDMDSLDAMVLNLNVGYDYGNGLSSFVDVGYDKAAAAVTYDIGLGYAVSF